MYSILGNHYKDVFDDFMSAFEYQQEYHPEKRIICSHNDGLIEIVWEPEWAHVDCENI